MNIVNYEVKLANGKVGRFNDANDLYNWCTQNAPKMEFSDSESKKNIPSLSEWFERRQTRKSS